ncbi:MAG: DUF2249 domain-containing protein [Alphaproteobacteria bacterium]|nr:MAG: DUF2249 domain-containing protein [Alphaproteobacteria bacterium]
MREIVIEANTIPAPERHNFIFSTFDSLEAGDSIIISNTHDPKPLLNQFNENRTSQYTSEYLLSGPTEWRVKLTKKLKEGCCGCC